MLVRRLVFGKPLVIVCLAILLFAAAQVKASSTDCVRLISEEIKENWIANAITGKVTQSDFHNLIARPYAISPDSESIVYRNLYNGTPTNPNEHQLFVQSWVGEPIILQSSIPHNSGVNVKFVWSPDSKRFIYTAIAGYISHNNAKNYVFIAEPNGKQVQIAAYDPTVKSLFGDAPFLELDLLGWSSDGEYTAFIRYNEKDKITELNFWSVIKNQLTTFKLPEVYSPYRPRFIGQVWQDHQLAFVHKRKDNLSTDSLYIVSVDDGTIETYTLPSSDQQEDLIHHLAWSNNGKFIAVVSKSDHLYILDTQQQKFIENIRLPLTSPIGALTYCGDCMSPNYHTEPVTWSADSSTAYVFQGQGKYEFLKPSEFILLNITAGKSETLLTQIKDAKWLEPAKLLAYTVQDVSGDKFYWFDVANRIEHYMGEWANLDFGIWDVVLSPNKAQMILSFTEVTDAKENNLNTVVKLLSLNGELRMKLTNAPFIDPDALVWSPDSTKLAIVQINKDQEPELLIFDNEGVLIQQFTDALDYGGIPVWIQCNQ